MLWANHIKDNNNIIEVEQYNNNSLKLWDTNTLVIRDKELNSRAKHELTTLNFKTLE